MDRNDELRHGEEVFEKLIKVLKSMDKGAKSCTYVLVPERAAEVLHVYNLLKNALTEDSDCKITCVLPKDTMAVIRIEAETIMFKDNSALLEAGKYATNMEIMPQTNGKLIMSFGFHGAAKRLELGGKL